MLSDDGFLLDRNPQSLWRPANKMLRTLDEMRDDPCIVLLGEPGMGKSTELRRAFDGARSDALTHSDAALLIELRDVDSSQALARKVTERPEVVAWRAGSHTLTLFIDSLDEGLLGVPALASNLAALLEDLDAKRLRLRLASRVADWPKLLEDALARRWGKQVLRIMQMAPLRESDVGLAAGADLGSGSGGFMTLVKSRGIGAMASRPVTLRLLLTTFLRNGSLAESRRELYDQGCRVLAAEDSDSRKASKRTGRLSPKERTAVAARIAFVLVFSNRSAVWTDTDLGNVPLTDVAIDAFFGGVETAGGVSVEVAGEEVREVLDTGLFTTAGQSRISFSHKTYAEHLAAWYAAQHRLVWQQVKGLLLHPCDVEQRVVPQLREVAARLTEHGPRILRKIVGGDPDIVLESDLRAAPPGHRRDVVDALFRKIRREQAGIGSILDAPDLGVLAHPNLEVQLRAVLADKSDHDEVRRLAIDIAAACELRALSDLITSIVLDEAESFGVRHHAGYAILRVGDAVGRTKFKRLATDPSVQDTLDQLKGNALAAAWPAYMDTDELFRSLTFPKNPDHFGPYEQFLHQFAANVKREHLVPALDWALPHATEGGHLGAAVTGILRRGWDNLDAPGVLQRFAGIAHERLQHRDLLIDEDDRALQRVEGETRFEDEVAEDALRRRSLIGALIPLAKEPSDIFALFHGKQAVVSTTDGDWVVERLRATSDDDERHAWAELLWGLFFRSGMEAGFFDLIYRATEGVEGDATIRKRFADLLEPVALDSPRANRLREEAKESAKWEARRRKEREGFPARADKVREYLDKFELGEFDAWWHMCQYIGRNAEGTEEQLYYLDITERAVWQLLGHDLQLRVVDAAVQYVRTRTADPDKWVGKKVIHWPAVSGYRALLLLQSQARTQLDQLPDTVWGAWASILVAQTVYGLEAESADYASLIAHAYRKAPAEVTATLTRVIAEEDAESRSLFVLPRMAQCWDDSLGRATLDMVRGGQLSPRSVEMLLFELVAHGVDVAVAYLTEILRNPDLDSAEVRDRAMLAGRVLLSTGARTGRSVVWPIMKASPTFGSELLLSIGDNRDWLIPNVQHWDDGDIADLYLWLEDQFPWKQDVRPHGVFSPSARFNIGEWRRRLISILERRGTAASVGAVQRIVNAMPLPWHSETLRNAREAMRRETWAPPNPSQLLELVATTEIRLVRDGNELLRVLEQSLLRFEDDLQGETPLARTLWYPAGARWRPRDEGDLADAIEQHLSKDLNGRGIMAGREVVIRRGPGGQRTDLYIYAVTKGRTEDHFDTVFAVIEVKGSWHAEVTTAMQSQLVGQYLHRNQRTRHGLYVVGWYASPHWDTTDGKRAKAGRFRTTERLRKPLQRQAIDLSASGQHVVSSIVLDVSLDLAGAVITRSAKKARKPKRV